MFIKKRYQLLSLTNKKYTAKAYKKTLDIFNPQLMSLSWGKF